MPWRHPGLPPLTGTGQPTGRKHDPASAPDDLRTQVTNTTDLLSSDPAVVVLGIARGGKALLAAAITRSPVGSANGRNTGALGEALTTGAQKAGR